MIAFKNTISLTVVTEFDEEKDMVLHQTEELFLADEPVNADVISHDGHGHVDLQFADGRLALGVHESCFNILVEA